MSTWIITGAEASAGTVTLTLSNASRFGVGYKVHVVGVGHQLDGHHTLTAVDKTLNTITYTHDNITLAAVAVEGLISPVCEWITEADVEAFLSLEEGDGGPYLTQVVEASNSWCFERREEAGYIDNPNTPSTARVKQGAILYAGALFREQGSIDSFQSYQDQPLPGVIGNYGQVMKQLGIPRPAIA